MNDISVKSSNRFRIPVNGKIRSGTKILTKAAQAIPDAVRIYEAGLAKNVAFDLIQDKIEKHCKKKYALVPKNTPHFHARACDFSVPDQAGEIFNLCAEERSDEGRQIYRIPVIFASDDLELTLPHAFRCYSASQLLYWSDIESDGNRRCMTRKPVVINQKTKRAKRPFAQRGIVLRESNKGVCNPLECDEFQERKCNPSGSLIFGIHGMAGIYELPTGSVYAIEQMRQQLMTVTQMRGGVSGLSGGEPLFYLHKAKRKVSRIMEDGSISKQPHWIVELGISVNMTNMFGHKPALGADTNAAVALLEPGKPANTSAERWDAKKNYPAPEDFDLEQESIEDSRPADGATEDTWNGQKF